MNSLLKGANVIEKDIDTDHPSHSTIEITVAGDSKISGRSYISHRIAKFLADLGYGNVQVSSTEGPEFLKQAPYFINVMAAEYIKKNIRVNVIEQPCVTTKDDVRTSYYFQMSGSDVPKNAMSVGQAEFECRRLAVQVGEREDFFLQLAGMIKSLPDVPTGVFFNRDKRLFHSRGVENTYQHMPDGFHERWINRWREFPSEETS